MSLIPNLPVGFNMTIANNSDTLCTLQICPLTLAHVDYLPNLGGNLFYTTIFGLAIVAQIGLAIRYKIWGFGCAMFGGLVLEILGYVARVQMHSNPFIKNPFLQYVSPFQSKSSLISLQVFDMSHDRTCISFGRSLSLLLTHRCRLLRKRFSDQTCNIYMGLHHL